jgi:cytidine deaminase
VENSSYGATICAERVAVSAAVAAGNKSYKRLVLISVNPEPITPCGICRQFLHELLEPKAEIVCYGSQGKKSIKYKMADLLPSGFTKADIRPTR